MRQINSINVLWHGIPSCPLLTCMGCILLSSPMVPLKCLCVESSQGSRNSEKINFNKVLAVLVVRTANYMCKVHVCQWPFLHSSHHESFPLCALCVPKRHSSMPPTLLSEFWSLDRGWCAVIGCQVAVCILCFVVGKWVNLAGGDARSSDFLRLSSSVLFPRAFSIPILALLLV